MPDPVRPLHHPNGYGPPSTCFSPCTNLQGWPLPTNKKKKKRNHPTFPSTPSPSQRALDSSDLSYWIGDLDMSQCVPNEDLDDPSNSSHALPLHPSRPGSTPAPPPYASSSSMESRVAELTWVNGHPSMHGLWPIYMEKGGGTLESVIDQATGSILLPTNPQSPSQPEYDLVPCITAHQRRAGEGCPATTIARTAAAAIMDALVPCSKSLVGDEGTPVPDPGGRRKQARAGGKGNCSVSGSAASMGLQVDSYEVNGEDIGFTTSTPPLEGSPETEDTSYRRPLAESPETEDTSSRGPLAGAVDQHDSASHSRHSKEDGVGEENKKAEMGRSSISTKRSRTSAVHNQSERKRRDRINQRMKTLQKLVPNSSKTDKASMLDEVIDYLKQLQAQVQMMSRMTTMAPPMMMPLPVPVPVQQLQMAMMAQMGMGLGMAMAGADMNALSRSQTPQPAARVNPPPPAAATLHPPSFLPPAPLPFAAASSWDGSDQRATAHATASPLPTADPFAALMTCQPQMPMNMDAFNRIAAAMYQQPYQQPSQQNPDLNN